MPDDFPPTEIPAPDSPAPPDIPDYTLLRRIGRGSYGDVWLARSVTGVFRVIKVVQRSRFEDSRPYLRELEGISRFQAAVSGRPRQLALLHVGRNDEAGYFYYVMEPADDVQSGSAIDPDRYVPLTLREMFKRRGRLPAAECVQFVLELARGLAVLHGENLIHRDIKPSNVIFVQRVPKLADVGLVASADATLTGVGTPGYIAPEGPGSVASDIYSLGKVLYEIATGMDRMEFPRIPKELADLPDAPLLREINGIVLKACHRFPDQRHASAEALARDLELVQAGRSVVFYEEFRKKSRAVLFVTATLAILAGLAAALFVWRAQVFQRANVATRRALYRSDLAVAQLARASGDLGRARAALGRQIPATGQEDLRGLEWAILARAVRGDGTPLEDVPNPTAINKIAVDPSGRWVAASFLDERAALWDLRTGRLTRILDNVKVLGGFLPDGRLVIDEPDRILRYESPLGGIDSRLSTEQRLYRMLPDGKLLVVTPEGDLVFRLLDPSGQVQLGQYNLATIHSNLVNSGQDTSPDGKRIVIGAYLDEGAIRARVLLSANLQTSQIIWQIQPRARIVWIRYSPTGDTVAVNIGGLSVTIIDPESGKLLHTFSGHKARVQDGSYSTDGTLFATASADQTVRVWDVKTGQPISIHQGLGRPTTAVAWLNGTNSLVAADDTGKVRVFPFPNTETPDVAPDVFDDLHGDLAFSPDAALVAVTKTTNSIAIIAAKDCTLVQAITNLFQPIGFDLEGTSIFALANNWTIWKHHLSSGFRTNLNLSLPEGFSVDGWAVSEDCGKVAFAGNSGMIFQFDLRSGTTQTVKDPDTNRVWAIAYSKDSTELWTGTEGGKIRRWNSKALGRPETTINVDGDLQALALSRDGNWLAASLFNDSSLRLWDRRLQVWLQPRFAHRRFVQSLVFTDDTQRLVSGGVDGRVVIWRVPEFEEIASFEVSPNRKPDGDEGIAALRLAPDKGGLGVLTEDGRLQIWRTR